MLVSSVQAWNNFVMRSNPACYERESLMRAAAIANRFMGGANNGGLNSFLNSSYDLDAYEVQNALVAVGAKMAARQLQSVLDGLCIPLPVSSQGERWSLLEKYWRDELNEFEALSKETNDELMSVLENHVAANEDFYVKLG